MTENETPYPISLSLSAEGELIVDWSDDRKQSLRPSFLRKRCPCANCMEKRMAMLKKQEAPDKGGTTLFPIVSPNAEQVSLAKVEPVGNYGYRIEFNDGHSAGVFTIEYLRSLDPTEV